MYFTSYDSILYDFHSVHIEFFKDIPIDMDLGGITIGTFLTFRQRIEVSQNKLSKILIFYFNVT